MNPTRGRRRTSPSLATIVRRALAGECALPPGARILVAVSGGPDSMALLDTLARVAPKLGHAVEAHGVDHGLRAGASAELDLAEAHALRSNVPFARTIVEVASGGNLQARARDARWAALVDVARDRNAVIATAHHAEDRAETLLMRLLRGAGARGLAVLPPRAMAPVAGARTVAVVRPLLRARRAAILAHIERNAVPFATDPSNVDPRYLRTAVRRDVLPLLSTLDPRVVDHLAALADELHDDVRAASDGLDPRAPWVASLPRATRVALADLERAGSPNATVWLPGGFVVTRDPRARSKKVS